MTDHAEALGTVHQKLRMARRWSRSGIIDQKQLRRIQQVEFRGQTPMHPVLSVVVFVLTIVGLGATFAFLMSVVGNPSPGETAIVAFFVAAVTLGFALVASRSLQVTNSGLDWGMQVGAVVFLCAAVVSTLDAAGAELEPLFVAAVATAVAGAGAARFGTTHLYLVLFACASCCIYFVAVDVLEVALDWRLVVFQLWFALAFWLVSRLRKTPAGEKLNAQLLAIEVASVAFVYVCANHFVADFALVEVWDATSGASGAAPMTGLHLALTALLPVVFTIAGLATRRALLIRTGIVTFVVSTFTFQHHFFRDHLEAFLLVSGAALIAGTWLAHRLLGQGRGGFMSRPLLSNELEDLNLDSFLMGRSGETVKPR